MGASTSPLRRSALQCRSSCGCSPESPAPRYGSSAAPRRQGATDHLAALLVPPAGPISPAPVELAVPPGGTGYLSDNDPGADLLLLWDVGAPLELCGLSP